MGEVGQGRRRRKTGRGLTLNPKALHLLEGRSDSPQSQPPQPGRGALGCKSCLRVCPIWRWALTLPHFGTSSGLPGTPTPKHLRLCRPSSPSSRRAGPQRAPRSRLLTANQRDRSWVALRNSERESKGWIWDGRHRTKLCSCLSAVSTFATKGELLNLMGSFLDCEVGTLSPLSEDCHSGETRI